MESKPPFRVVIVGGGIGGLSLANMLQKAGIDYIVLEAYPDIAPQVGASIGLNGFGLRILDQIDCYDDIRAMIAPLDHVLLREGKTGRLLAKHRGIYKVQEERHGYPTCFLDRQSVLQVLYDHIQDKSKILTSTRVVTAAQTENGVTVTTENGTVYHGDILVGCDGVHSIVRKEMWRLADESQPGWFPASEKTAMKAIYSCIYGISIEESVKPGEVHATWHERKSHGIMTGPGGRVYWFLLFNTGKVHYMPNIPRYTLEDENDFVEKYSSDLVTGDLTIGDLYKGKISSTMTPLPEYCYKKWFFNRMITIGDSSHVFHPITGQGGNGALESAVALVNELYASLQTSKIQLSTAQITSIFLKVQESRYDRASRLVKTAHKQQRVDAMETPILKFLALNVVPWLGTSSLLHRLSSTIPGGMSLNMVNVPKRSRTIPFEDELLRAPKSRGWVWYLSILFFLALSVVCYVGMHVRHDIDGTTKLFEASLKLGIYPGSGLPLRQHWIGFKPFDDIMTLFVSAFFPIVSGGDSHIANKGVQFVVGNFLFTLLPFLAICNIEAYRYANQWGLITFTSLWAILYQVLGIGTIAPLFFIAYITKSDDPSYWWPIYSNVPICTASAILPALLIGYLLPTCLMFAPLLSSDQTQISIAIWQFSPFLFNILVPIFARLIPEPGPHSTGSNNSENGKYVKALNDCVEKLETILAGAGFVQKEESINDSKQQDIKGPPYYSALEVTYFTTIMISAISHVITLFASFTIRALFPKIPYIFFTAISSSEVETLHEGLARIFMADYWIFSIATLAFSLLAVWDLRRVGRVEVCFLRWVVGLPVLTVLIGPGAMVAVVWLWRERVLIRRVEGRMSGKGKLE